MEHDTETIQRPLDFQRFATRPPVFVNLSDSLDAVCFRVGILIGDQYLINRLLTARLESGYRAFEPVGVFAITPARSLYAALNNRFNKISDRCAIHHLLRDQIGDPALCVNRMLQPLEQFASATARRSCRSRAAGSRARAGSVTHDTKSRESSVDEFPLAPGSAES